jgi:NAD(P)-dependent dehydrogenase (short-subunit alcohol dehydrogenase family)
MHIQLEGKTALISGAASGIGRAIAAGMHRAGAQVVIADINLNAAQQTAAELGVGASALALDAADVEACQRAIDMVIEQKGHLDILVNNAGICPLRPIEQVDQAHFDQIVAVNMRGPFFLSQAAAIHMKARQTGRIINISSVGGKTGGAMDIPVYASTKAALFSITKSFAKYLAPHGTANTIAPGPSVTPLTDAWDAPAALESLRRAVPLQRLGQPEDYVGAALFLASDYAAYITGATLDVNGGFRMD